MNKFADSLKVMFFEGKNMIRKREDYKYSKLSEDGSLYLDLNSPKDRMILDLIIKSDIIHVDGIVYTVLKREFMLDGTGLFICIEKIEHE